MQIGSENWLNLITMGAKQMGICVTQQQAEQFAIHAQRLVQWNKKVNLTAITDPVQVAIKHFLDVLAPLPYLSSKGQLLDIGTGGGFPGLPLKIVAPDLDVTLIDGVRKKINFVKHIIRVLALENIHALHIRAEELANELAYKGRFQFIVARAVTDMAAFINYALPLLAANGVLILYQSSQQIKASKKKWDADWVAINQGIFRVSVFSYNLPFSEEGRALTLLRHQTSLSSS